MSESETESNGQGSWEQRGDEVYTAVTSGNPEDKAHALTELRSSGLSDEEAETIYATAAGIAVKSGSREAFLSIIKGELEAPAELAEEEVELFGFAAAAPGGGAGVGSAKYGRTWEGSSNVAKRPAGTAGRTWEGSSGRKRGT